MERPVHGRWLLLALTLATTAGLVTAPNGAASPARESKAFFTSGEVVHLSIDLDKKDLDSLRREPRKYVKATLTEGKVVYRNVGIHIRGAAGSTRGIDDKPGLTLNMNKFEEKKLFHGMDKWHLCNSVQDPSYLAELICGELYRAAGVPASRVSHALVTINGKKRGLYYLKEGYDRHFRKQNFTDPGGNFYDGGFLRDVDQQLQLLSGPGGKKQTELQALVAASRDKKPQERFKKLEKLLDMDRFISYLCLQTLTWDWDGYPMNRNNYRVYHDPRRDRIVFIPSGMDQMFADTNGTILPEFRGLVARAVMDTPEGRERYLKRMAEILKKVFDPDALGKRLDELKKKIQPALASVDAGAGRQFPNQVKRLQDAMRARAKSIEGQLKKVKK
jgi:hypothetical protein